MTVTTPQLGAALSLIGEVVTQPAFKQEELDRLRAQALDELKVAYSSPGTVATLTANRMLFGSGAYGHPAAGTPASLPRLTRADVATLHHTYYRPDNAVLVLAGDISLAEAVPLAARYFGRWRAPAAALPVVPAAAGAASGQPLTLVDMGASGQAGVVLMLPLPASGGADQAVGEVTNAVLGGDYSSRLSQEIRIKRGLSYGASSSLDARRQAGLLRAAVQTKNESAADVVALLQAEIDGIANAPVPEDELAARKATLIGKFSRSVETTAGLLAQVASMVAAGLPLTDLPKRIGVLSAVEAADVQRYVRMHFGAAQRRIAVAGEASQFEAALKAAVPGLVSMKQESLDLEQ